MKRYPGTSERVLHFLTFMREVPYITSADFIRYFYPLNKVKSYALDTLRILVRRKWLARYRLNDGSNIYYLTEEGHAEASGYAQFRLRFDPVKGCLYYLKPPRFDNEKPGFIYLPAPLLDFRLFSYSMLSSYQYLHTRGVLEFLYLVRKANRVLYSVNLDMVKSKKTALQIQSNPDILLTNDIQDSQNRILIEFENSKIWEGGLLAKLNNIARETADSILFLCGSEGILKNLGRILNKLVAGDFVKAGMRALPSKEALASLQSRMYFGTWRPSYLNGGEVHRLSEILLFRYDAKLFEPGHWQQKVINGILQRDDFGNPIMVYNEQLAREEGIPFTDFLADFQVGFVEKIRGLSREQAAYSVSE